MDSGSLEYVFWEFPFKVMLKKYELLLRDYAYDPKRIAEIKSLSESLESKNTAKIERDVVDFITSLAYELDDEEEIFH